MSWLGRNHWTKISEASCCSRKHFTILYVVDCIFVSYLTTYFPPVPTVCCGLPGKKHRFRIEPPSDEEHPSQPTEFVAWQQWFFQVLPWIFILPSYLDGGSVYSTCHHNWRQGDTPHDLIPDRWATEIPMQHHPQNTSINFHTCLCLVIYSKKYFNKDFEVIDSYMHHISTSYNYISVSL